MRMMANVSSHAYVDKIQLKEEAGAQQALCAAERRTILRISEGNHRKGPISLRSK